ncbi:sigma-70 family RNA polymerase sigma factor [Enterococcus sp. DIV0242_7C1]|uniref:RNA polymerase primary sigma factor n=2 Tax=Candidatus Enterococcus dunnyi TaxID=1834192 RepID=A0AAQ3W3H0_9ENTE|nr:sigma-70 family RNA polymerase sigma factor [Enterococcus sp. DIV0242_7C1]MBO0471466.1 sigma-70 family RNA polymerase sigma factor [Enterococcus sp. DIV0242_7C1]
MNNNLYLIIEYINDNLLFGSKVRIEEIESLFKKYSIANEEKKIVYKELESLNIEVIETRSSFKEKIDILFSTIGEKKEFRESELLDWFVTERINLDMQKLVRKVINSEGFSLINDIPKKIGVENLGFLNDLDFTNLDSVLDDESFNAEVENFKAVIDKSHNLDYLIELHSNSVNAGKKTEALDNLVKANRQLVWKIAAKYSRFATVSFDLNDMYQVGMQGLMKAAEKFDASMEYQFSTYATWWIRQGITRGISNYSTTIRIPVHMRDKIVKISKIENDFWNHEGRVVSLEELAKILEVSTKEVQDMKFYKEIGKLTSLDTPIGSEKDSYLGDFIRDDKNQSPEEYMMEKALKDELSEIMDSNLKKREARILKFRFGLVDGKQHTLEEIGQVEKVTRERIRQIESKALRKLKKQQILERLRNFYYDGE